MRRKNIKIAGIQETNAGVDCRENRGGYTWFFSGREKTIEGYTAGVGMVVSNTYMKYVAEMNI